MCAADQALASFVPRPLRCRDYPGFEVAQAACAADATAEGVFLHQVRKWTDDSTSAAPSVTFSPRGFFEARERSLRKPVHDKFIGEVIAPGWPNALMQSVRGGNSSTSSFRRPTRNLARYMAVRLFSFIYPLRPAFETVCNSCVAHHLPPWFSAWRCSATRLPQRGPHLHGRPAILKARGCKERHVLCSTRALGHKRALSDLPSSRRYFQR